MNITEEEKEQEHGCTQAEHDDNLFNVVERVKANYSPSTEKSVSSTTKIYRYFGMPGAQKEYQWS